MRGRRTLGEVDFPRIGGSTHAERPLLAAIPPAQDEAELVGATEGRVGVEDPRHLEHGLGRFLRGVEPGDRRVHARLEGFGDRFADLRHRGFRDLRGVDSE